MSRNEEAENINTEAGQINDEAETKRKQDR